MPVSFVPIFVVLALLALPVVGAAWRGRRGALLGGGVAAVVVLGLLCTIYAPGPLLDRRADAGDGATLYALARWRENHCASLQSILPAPCQADVQGGYRALVKAAEAGNPEAMYVLGARLVHDQHVAPEAGDESTRIQAGRAWLARARAAGFEPTGPEDRVYWSHFRR